MTLSSLHSDVDLCYAATGDNIVWIRRGFYCWTSQLNAKRCSKGWCSWKKHPDGFWLFSGPDFVKFLFLFKTSDLGVAWACEEWKFLRKTQVYSEVLLLLDVNTRVFNLSRFSLCNCVRRKRKERFQKNVLTSKPPLPGKNELQSLKLSSSIK